MHKTKTENDDQHQKYQIHRMNQDVFIKEELEKRDMNVPGLKIHPFHTELTGISEDPAISHLCSSHGANRTP